MQLPANSFQQNEPPITNFFCHYLPKYSFVSHQKSLADLPIIPHYAAPAVMRLTACKSQPTTVIFILLGQAATGVSSFINVLYIFSTPFFCNMDPDQVSRHKNYCHNQATPNSSLKVIPKQNTQNLGYRNQWSEYQCGQWISNFSSFTTKKANFKKTHRKLMEVKAVGTIGGITQFPSAPDGQASIRHRPKNTRSTEKALTWLALLKRIIADQTSKWPVA